MRLSRKCRCRWVVFGLCVLVMILLAACGNSDDAAPNNTEIRSQTPFPTPMPTSPASPENAIHFNTFSHISGAITITYPSNWLIETDGNEVNGSVNIGNTRSAQIGNPTRDSELSIAFVWSPATALVSEDVPQDISPLPLLATIIDEWADNATSAAQFSEPSEITVRSHQGARADGVTVNNDGVQLATALFIVDFGDGVAGYFTVKTPGELEEFEPLFTRIIESTHYGGPPAIVVTPPEDLIEPLYEVAHLQDVRGILITEDGSRFISWSNDASVVVRDTHDGYILQSFALPTRVTAVSISNNEEQLLIQPEGEALSLWSLDTGEQILSFQANSANSPLNGFAWSPNNYYLMGWAVNYSSGASLVPIWDISDGTTDDRPRLPFETHRPSVNKQITSGTWNHNSTQFVIVNSSPLAYIYDARGNESIFAPAHTDNIFGAAWRSDDEQVMTWSQDKLVIIWDVASGELVQVFQHERPVRGAVWRDDDREILSWQVDSGVFVWDTSTWRKRIELDTGSASGGAVWSRSLDYIVTWSHELVRVPRVRIWDAETGRMMAELVGENILDAAAFSPDETQLVSWSDDGIISVWNIETGAWDFVMRHDGVQGVQWTPDGSRLVSWSTDGTIRVWDANPNVDYGDVRR